MVRDYRSFLNQFYDIEDTQQKDKYGNALTIQVGDKARILESEGGGVCTTSARLVNNDSRFHNQPRQLIRSFD
jgi:hypothetical protein